MILFVSLIFTPGRIQGRRVAKEGERQDRGSRYQVGHLIDCKLLLNELFVQKTKSREDLRQDVREVFRNALHNIGGTCLPVHIRLANTAFDWTALCQPGVLPAEIFSPMWNPDLAFLRGLITEDQQRNLNLDIQAREALHRGMRRTEQRASAQPRDVAMNLSEDNLFLY